MKRSLLLTLISLKVEILKSHFFFKLRNPSDFSDEGGGKWGGLEGPAVDRLFLREIENVRAEGLQCIVGLLLTFFISHVGKASPPNPQYKQPFSRQLLPQYKELAIFLQFGRSLYKLQVAQIRLSIFFKG